MFSCPRYLLDTVRRLMVRNGDLNLLGDYMVVGLGGGFNVLPDVLSDVEDVSGDAVTIKSYTGYFKGLRISAIAMAGGPSYAEWAVALAYMRGVKALIGVGWCGALQENIRISDAVIPIASLRDEDTISHYVDPRFPAVADPTLVSRAISIVSKHVERLGSRVWVGVTVSASAMLAESLERVREWKKCRILCVDEETSTIYTLSYLAGIPALTLLAVSDNVILGMDIASSKELSDRVDNTYKELVKSALEILVEVNRSSAKPS